MEFKTPNKMSKKYRLLKDLPITLAGTTFYPKENKSSVYKPENGGWLEEVPEEIVTGRPDWFEEIKEPSHTQQEAERISVRIIPNENYAEGKWYGWYVLETPKAIPENKLQSIKEAIEKVLNEQPPQQEPKRDWEIVAYARDDKSYPCISTKRKNGRFLNDNDPDKDGQYDEPYKYPWRIHSVRRLSDGTVWTVRQICFDEVGHEFKPIKRFFEKEGVMYAQFDEGHGSNDGCLGINSLMPLPPKPQVLFTTEDDVPVHLNQRVWWVRNSDFMCNFHDFYEGENHYPEEFKYFSTKEKADEWVLMNKPRYSVKEAYDFLCVYMPLVVRSAALKAITENAKQKQPTT